MSTYRQEGGYRVTLPQVLEHNQTRSSVRSSKDGAPNHPGAKASFLRPCHLEAPSQDKDMTVCYFGKITTGQVLEAMPNLVLVVQMGPLSARHRNQCFHKQRPDLALTVRIPAQE